MMLGSAMTPAAELSDIIAQDELRTEGALP